MTVASEIQRIEGNISAAYTAADAKGATLPATENSDNLATCIASIPSGGGSSGKYQLLDRVTDDSNNEIGTVSGFFVDANNVEYAVVCLDAQYRLAQGMWCSDTSTAITNLPTYPDQSMFSAKETSTFNTQKILDFCTSTGATSSACTHCRSKSFTIDGVVYYGQFPNLIEVIDISSNRVDINTKDTSGSSYNSLLIPTNENDVWTSTQATYQFGWSLSQFGGVTAGFKTAEVLIIPVLEIPNV